MEQTETTSTPTSTSGLRQQETRMSSVSGSETRSSAPWKDTSARSTASQDLARELDRLIDRLPTLSGDNLEQAKAEFVQLAARSGSAATELAAKSAEVARQVKGRVKNEWETGLERTESFVHANPVRALAMALGIGVVLGARLFGGHRHHRDM
ncbi:conserved hypothetical protein [Cupriavidus phytorum]|uniref:DUF883 domain-containing protein n=2 Tax=Cupriavidus TaxID=106589 RepID=A0A976FRS1_9BURK|nr:MULTISPECIES: hypothetical protein [Cupriavidus]PZX23974.1 ElaB/YqjD/DUF883 family membrane-anchored ribosome-binding protein [Cupriavidus alkaliphilus]SOY75751.1 conserved hypothetical protein [Cupriavidus taiwanensis]